MSARPGLSGGYRVSGIPTGISKCPGRLSENMACYHQSTRGAQCRRSVAVRIVGSLVVRVLGRFLRKRGEFQRTTLPPFRAIPP